MNGFYGRILKVDLNQKQFSIDTVKDAVYEKYLGGKGLAAGAKMAEVEVHQLDWDHLLRPLWGQVTRLEKQAYAALTAVAERAAKFDQSTTHKRLAHHLAAWERLSAEAEEKVVRYDDFFQVAQQVDTQFALIDLESGQLQDPVAGAERLRDLGRQLQGWNGRIYEKLSSNLINWAEGLLRYQSVLNETISPLFEQWGAPAIHALCRIWQIEADGCSRYWWWIIREMFTACGLDGKAQLKYPYCFWSEHAKAVGDRNGKFPQKVVPVLAT